MRTSGNRRRPPLLLATHPHDVHPKLPTLNASPASSRVARVQARQRPAGRGRARPSRARRHALRLVSRGLGRRAAGRLGHRPLPRAPDVQVDGQDRRPATSPRSSRGSAARTMPSPATTCTGYFQRISKDRLKTVMEMEADRMVNLKLDREGGGDRARGDPRGAPLAHREQPVEHPLRADVGGALSEPSLPHPHHRLDARDGQALARGCAGLLQALLCAQQRHRRRRRRRHRRGGEGAGRGHLRPAQAQPRDQDARAAAGAAASRRRAAWSSRTRAPATPRCGASTWRPAYPTPPRARPRRSTC